MMPPTHCQQLLIVDDHESMLENLVSRLQQQYPDAHLNTAGTVQQALDRLAMQLPDVLVLDLAIPAEADAEAEFENGIQLLRTVLERYPELNVVVLSSKVQTLVRIKPLIDNHEGGFTAASKVRPMQTILTRVDWALQGINCIHHELRSSLEVKSEWLEMLQLAFQEGLQDKAIAERMHVAERTIRHYWRKVQDVLSVYPEPGTNMRIQTGIRAREKGLID